MQSEKAAVIRRRRRNLKNPQIMPALVCGQRLLRVHEAILNRQLKDVRKVNLERNTYKRKVHQLQSVCKKQFVLSMVSPMYIVMSFRCVLRKRLGKDEENVDILPC